jgi:drug/metabolite transporter (DMT)-like permease
MSAFWAGNVYLLVSMLFGAASQIVFKALFNEVGPLVWPPTQLLDHPGAVMRIATALILLGGAFVFWMMSISRLNLSYAYPIACASALLVACFSVFFLGEAVSLRMWLGTVLIVLGTIFLSLN